MTTAEFSVEIDATPEAVWDVTSDPRNLPHWARYIVRVYPPPEPMGPGVEYAVVMGFAGVHATVPCRVLEWEPPWRARVHLGSLLDATVTTSIASLPYDRCMLRHEVEYVFRGPLGRFAAASVSAVGGSQLVLRRGALAQKREIEWQTAATPRDRPGDAL